MIAFNDNLPGLLKFQILEQFGDKVLDFVTTKQTPAGRGTNFNIGYSGDTDEISLLNREGLASALKMKENQFVFQTQVHKDNYKIVTEEDKGKGFIMRSQAIQDTDILVTNRKKICLVTRSADCVPVLLYSPDSKSIAAVHSGREGTYLGAAAKAAKILSKEFGANIGKMIACIGPAIGFHCYEVDEDCARKFVENPRFAPHTIEHRDGKAFLDLKTMIADDLVAAGLSKDNIEVSDICTKCSHDRFYSARMGDKGRFCAGIMIK